MFRIAIAAVTLTANLFACTFFPPVYKVPRTFTVHVKNDVGPVVGLTLKVSNAEVVTDGSGTARFTLDKTGGFTLEVVSPASQLDWVYVEVSDQTPPAVIDLQWPSYAILRTSRLRGKLFTGLYSSRSVPLSGMALRLHTPANYHEVSATTTSSDGSFEFKDVVPGLYLLQIVPDEKATNDLFKPGGNIAVYLTPEATADALEISTANTSCGLSYDLESNKSRYKPKACFKGGKPVQCDY